MRSKIGDCRKILALASVTVLTLGGTACQTEGPTDVSGQSITLSSPKAADPEEYHTRFVGEDAPKVTGARIIHRDNSMQNEIFGFVTDYPKKSPSPMSNWRRIFSRNNRQTIFAIPKKFGK